MKTHSGVLSLTKREKEALRVLKHHVLADISFGEGGTFNHEVGRDWPFDEKEANRAKLGLEVIDFILSCDWI